MKKINARKISSQILFLSLILSMIFTVYRIVTTSDHMPGLFDKQRSEYILTLLQCLLGLAVMSLPSLLNHRFSIEIPSFVEVMFYVFLFAAIYLGEVRSFYGLIPYWDTILHAFSGAMLGSLGFTLVVILNREVSSHVRLSPFFIAFFAFCFALSMGAIWEIYEFSMDAIFGTNMQKFMTYEGEILIGHQALIDTMKDIIVDASAALLVCVAGYIHLRYNVHRKEIDISSMHESVISE